MSWIGYKDKSGFAVDMGGLATSLNARPCGAPIDPQGPFLSIGSLLVEAIVDTTGEDQVLAFCEDQGSLTGIALGITASNLIWLRLGSASQTLRFDLPVPMSPGTHRLHIAYSWDTASNWAQFSVYLPDSEHLAHRFISNPTDLSLGLLNTLLSDDKASLLSGCVEFCSVSDQIEPIGPKPTLAGSSQVDTPKGTVALSDLKIGDLVTTPGNGVAQIRWIGSTLVPAKGSFKPICLRAPYYNLHEDLFMSGDQRLLQSGCEVEYLFGEEGVLVNSVDLIDGTSVLYAKTPDVIRYYHVLLDRHDIINVNGSWMESFQIGSLATDAIARQSSVLRNLPYELLPQETDLARPALRAFEAATLKSLRFA